MKASVFCLCLGLGIASLSSAAVGDPRGPVLIAGALTPAAGVFAAGAEGAEWLLPGGARVVAGAGAEFRVVGKPQKLPLGPRKNTPGYTVLLRSGELRVSVPSGGQSAVVVAAPRKTNVLVVSGTMTINASNERVAVANGEGQTSVGVGSDSLRTLPVGMMRQVDAGAGAVRPLADSPSALAAPSLAFSFGAEAAVGAMTWPQANGASRYRVEIRNDKGRVVRTRETGDSGLAAGAFRLPPGNYVARVATIDPSGLEAAKPAERPLRVVGVTVPERGFVDADGAVHLPTGDSLSLTNTDGVEMTYGGGDYFVAAPRSLDLVQPEPRLVRFRLPENPSEARLWLVPRQVRARVEFGPKVPTWPRDSLEIRVRVEESTPSASAPPIDVRARVMLGVEPVDVAFVREGNTLRGVLPPQVGKGPWVVRVEVNDPSGAELGRDFIEVARR